jgi:hypothetical protein
MHFGDFSIKNYFFQEFNFARFLSPTKIYYVFKIIFFQKTVPHKFERNNKCPKITFLQQLTRKGVSNNLTGKICVI